MTPDEIQNWQPRRFADVIGAANRGAVEQLRRAARQCATAAFKPLLLGPVGTAKTNLARLLLQSFCCERPDPATADPCGSCAGCHGCRPEENGGGAPLQHWVFDCGEGVGKEDVIGFLRAYQFHDKNAVLFDELGDLPAPAQKSLLRYLSPFPGGLFVATLTLDRRDRGGLAGRLVEPLLDRLTPRVELSRPKADELITFLEQLASSAGVSIERGAVRSLVARTGGSFRQCLGGLADAARREDRTLRHAPAGEYFIDSEDDPVGARGATTRTFPPAGGGW